MYSNTSTVSTPVGTRLEIYIMRNLGRYVDSYAFDREGNRGYRGWQFMGEPASRATVDDLVRRLPGYLRRLVREFGPEACAYDAFFDVENHFGLWKKFGRHLIPDDIWQATADNYGGLCEETHEALDQETA
ncbi:hypothetical protein G3N56_07715 [Desulfovibrio sulfodismutans]|uniref:Uncharacterized protein n=1 Tax=Desulfolutivibrio sulfodismutans TaxID=63561 RepID=A0A7K3NK96_9BACT|nr:hypothetical protein [Desulfolutivibrio sulfodismutans]NDY56628.1 hypothetical protein [Desulfolutivibrio sulfodismutans]QLA11271.1 hypothetical protein GD606_02740 [Desulfolutivibrio sulfodismutans DSM 3696]